MTAFKVRAYGFVWEVCLKIKQAFATHCLLLEARHGVNEKTPSEITREFTM